MGNKQLDTEWAKQQLDRILAASDFELLDSLPDNLFEDPRLAAIATTLMSPATASGSFLATAGISGLMGQGLQQSLVNGLAGGLGGVLGSIPGAALGAKIGKTPGGIIGGTLGQLGGTLLGAKLAWQSPEEKALQAQALNYARQYPQRIVPA